MYAHIYFINLDVCYYTRREIMDHWMQELILQ